MLGDPSKSETVWFVLLDASDAGLAKDPWVNYARKLANVAIGDPAAVQTVTLDQPSPSQNRFGQALVRLPGRAGLQPDAQRGTRHADAYSPLARAARTVDRQGRQGRAEQAADRRERVFNLAATRPDLLTGVDPATGQPAPYGAVGVDINCAVIGWNAEKPPLANLADPVPNSQFPPK